MILIVHVVLVGATLFKKAIVSNRFGMKFGRIVHSLI